jgi:hypothetical protein
MAKIFAVEDTNGNKAEVSLFDNHCLLRVGSSFDEDYYNGSIKMDLQELNELIEVLLLFKEEYKNKLDQDF